ncbi:MAG: HAMP domain-containing protein [Anaerolineae bacterium]|nr:HAMP domain-containing protein [Anaerolineae bacterium]
MNKLWVRLAAAFLVVVLLAVGAIALIVQRTTEHSFRTYLNRQGVQFFAPDVIEALQNHFADNQTWTGAESLLPGPGSGSGQGQGKGENAGRGGRGAAVLLADSAGTVVLATDTEQIGTVLDNAARDRAVQLTVAGEPVGWLVQVTPGEQALGDTEERFLSETTRWLTGAAIGAALLAVIVAGLLAWQLTHPLRNLTEAAHHLAEGQLGHQVTAQGATEITELANAFNRMSRDLAKGEILRQHMAANIAHELRTPVSVLRGHLEAMLDGVFPLDAAHLAVAYDRTIYLARLVDDLRLLTRAEAGQLPLKRTTIPAGELVRRAVVSFTPLAADANITLESDWPDDLPPVEVDIDRMQQVLGNLLTNALRHTPEHGTITVRVQRAGDRVRYAVINSGQGLTPDEAAHVFDPFWRAEEARERDSGGIGLGLSIARQMLLLHGGRIWAEAGSSAAVFTFELPVKTDPAP